MKAAGGRWGWFRATALLLLAACAHTPPSGKTHSGLNAPADHWVTVGQVAIVAARDGDAYLTASCYYGATIALMSTAEVKDQPQARSLALGFDGDAPARLRWVPRAYAPPRWGFEAERAHTPDFLRTLARIRVSQEAEAVVDEAGREVLHVHFSLVGAGDALAKAFTNCPP